MTGKIENSQVSAYVDKELDNQQAKDFEKAMLNDASLLDEVSQYAELKDKIKLSYAKEHTNKYKNHHSCERHGSFLGNCKQAVAAALVLAIGLFTFNNISVGKNTSIDELQTASLQDAPQGFKLNPVKFDQNKLLLHVSSSEPEDLEKVLFQAESLLAQYEKNNLSLQLEVIANSGGVDLMRTSVSPHAQKIRELQTRYEKVQFVACVNTLSRLAKSGENTELLPGITADIPVVEKIIGRIQNGWTYVKI